MITNPTEHSSVRHEMQTSSSSIDSRVSIYVQTTPLLSLISKNLVLTVTFSPSLRVKLKLFSLTHLYVFKVYIAMMLVSYMERNKVIKVPEEGDIVYLKKEFMKQFSFASQVSIDVAFQRYDNEWKEYVDLEECDTVANKEKLKVVVSSQLHTPVSPANTENTEKVCSN